MKKNLNPVLNMILLTAILIVNIALKSILLFASGIAVTIVLVAREIYSKKANVHNIFFYRISWYIIIGEGLLFKHLYNRDSIFESYKYVTLTLTSVLFLIIVSVSILISCSIAIAVINLISSKKELKCD